MLEIEDLNKPDELVNSMLVKHREINITTLINVVSR
jgi:hypothetical protein